MATYILGLSDQVSPVLTDTMDPNDNICEVNPLGKILRLRMAEIPITTAG